MEATGERLPRQRAFRLLSMRSGLVVLTTTPPFPSASWVLFVHWSKQIQMETFEIVRNMPNQTAFDFHGLFANIF